MTDQGTDEKLPRSVQRELRFANGTAIGISNRWHRGQYCSLLTKAGIVGCGIYDLVTPAEFGQAIAIAKGTPQSPLTEPEDLLEARIVGATPQAEALGIQIGMTGREAVELMLKAETRRDEPMSQTGTPLQVKHLDHVTVVVRDLDMSRRFYVGALGMREVPRPSFSFDGLWFQAGPTQIHLILEHGQSSKAGVNEPEAAVQLSRTHHFAFEVDDAHAAARRMSELGIPIVSGPKERPDGAVQVFVQDPDGHVVELCHPPRGS